MESREAERAARSGDVEWFENNAKSSTPIKLASPVSLASLAIQNDQSGVFFWLNNNSSPPLELGFSESYLLRTASSRGNLEVVKCLIESHSEQIDLTTHGSSLVLLTAATLNFEILKYFITEAPKFTGTHLDLSDLRLEHLAQIDKVDAEFSNALIFMKKHNLRFEDGFVDYEDILELMKTSQPSKNLSKRL